MLFNVEETNLHWEGRYQGVLHCYISAEQNEASGITFIQGKDIPVRSQEIQEKAELISKGIRITWVISVTCPEDSLLHLGC